MNKFLKYILLLVLFAYILPAIIAFSLPSNPNGYYKGYALKYNRLDTMKGHRVLIFGGSEIALAINTQLLQDSLKMNVANLGLHAGLGVDLNLKDALKHSRKGDIVLFSFSNFIGRGNGAGGLNDLSFLVDYYPNLFFELSNKNKRSVILGVFPLLKGKIKYLYNAWRGRDTQFYSLKGIDENGDVIKPSKGAYHYIDFVKIDSIDYVSGNTKYLNSVAESLNSLKQRGCTVYIIPSPRHEKVFIQDSLAIDRLATFLRVRGIDHLFDARESSIPDGLLYDNAYHTNNEGAVFYSNLIVKHLKPLVFRVNE